MFLQAFHWLRKRLRPAAGWPLALLALGAALCPALLAGRDALALPNGLLAWAGLLGVVLGLQFARLAGLFASRGWARHWAGALVRGLLWALALLGGGMVLVVAAGEALPPAELVAQDFGAYIGLSGRWLRGLPLGEAIEPRAWRFLQFALPRLGGALLAAPAAGEAGASLLLASIGLLATWASALVLGWALGAQRQLLLWGLPLLIALALLTIFGGASGLALIVGLGLLLLLAVMANLQERERGWDRAGAIYSDELGRDLLFWAAPAVVAALLLALAIPTTLPNPLAWLAPAPPALPSGLAALEQRVQRAGAAQPATVGLSELPALPLGVSLEQGPSTRLALRIGVAVPFSNSPWPRYWRARTLNRYDGRAWQADARRGSSALLLASDARPDGLLVQQVEDLRVAPATLVALPNPIALDVEAVLEQLPDGSLAALISAPIPRRYTVFSRPPELGSPPADPPDQAAPSDSLALPGSVPARVGELARALAANAATPLDQALALERYLRELPYAYEVRPVPRGGDAVDQFLFEMRQGYCTYYASAMAVMARSLGIPARLAIGYATGSYDPASGAYLVREGEAHAWPELYLDGRWLPFEPTPVRPLPERGGATTLPPAPVIADALPPQPAVVAPSVGLLAVLLVVALVLGAGAAGFIWWQRSQPLAVQAQQRLERLGRQAGVLWPAGATLHEYAVLLRARRNQHHAPLAELVALLEQSRYSGRPLSATQERRLRELIRVLGR